MTETGTTAQSVMEEKSVNWTSPTFAIFALSTASFTVLDTLE
ncbi:hypothetical protein QC761_0083170 [Podospora bellae-mahoneyi]|uniref:Uncharacterized protein n=1 Tax=Podospora bellae-mahoneyi TaxID=2093777 RepID=A0ABR0FHR1_9PEZI|nr:hypothetical protein QC761_0083170 [Podospora bellae-mahoneyi]